MRLMKLLGEIIDESQKRNLNEYEATWYEESRYIQELANPEMSYDFDEVGEKFIINFRFVWCCQRESNSRPLHYQ